MAKKKILSQEELDEINHYYIDELWNREQICKHFGFSETYFKKIIKEGLVQKKTQEQILQTMNNTNIEKYGDANYRNLEQAKQTLQERYGSTNYRNIEQGMKTKVEKYGVGRKEVLIEKKQTKIRCNENSNHANKKETKCSLIDRTTISQKVFELNLEDYAQHLSDSSNYEFEIRDFLISYCNVKEEEIEMHNRTILAPQEIDIYIPSRHMGIEFNGDYWHCDLHEKYQDHGGRSTYHQKKSLQAEEKGVFLFHIFEYEWNDPVVQSNIKNRLKTLLNSNGVKIPARKCVVQQISKEQKKEFLNTNHIQGNDRSSVYYGLFYQGEMVSCMTFTKPKNKQYTWELSRFCNKHNYIVQGGASKLFKHSIQLMNQGDTIVSYNDITKTSGKIYKTLQFSCISINNPNYIWMNFTTGDIRTRYQEQESGEVERMHKLNYHRICDCGTKTWLYKVK